MNRYLSFTLATALSASLTGCLDMDPVSSITDRDMWTKVIRHAKESGEIRSDTDVPKAVALFRQMFYGLSYEQAFLNGLDTKKLAEYFQYIYSLLKA